MLAAVEGTSLQDALASKSQQNHAKRKLRSMDSNLSTQTTVPVEERRHQWLCKSNLTTWYSGGAGGRARVDLHEDGALDHAQVILELPVWRDVRVRSVDLRLDKLLQRALDRAALGCHGDARRHRGELVEAEEAARRRQVVDPRRTDPAVLGLRGARVKEVHARTDLTLVVCPVHAGDVGRVLRLPATTATEPLVYHDVGARALRLACVAHVVMGLIHVEHAPPLSRVDLAAAVSEAVLLETRLVADRINDSNRDFRIEASRRGLIIFPGLPNGTAANQLMDGVFGPFKMESDLEADRIVAERMAAAEEDHSVQVKLSNDDLPRIMRHAFSHAFGQRAIKSKLAQLGLCPV